MMGGVGMTVYRDIGQSLREKRNHNNLTAAKLAEVSDTSITVIENIELGNKDPK